DERLQSRLREETGRRQAVRAAADYYDVTRHRSGGFDDSFLGASTIVLVTSLIVLRSGASLIVVGSGASPIVLTFGTNRVNERVMARRYEDLDVWKLADDLRREFLALTDTGPVSRDFRFRDQIRDAASSAARNIAEGFGRFRPSDFARFMEFSIASTMEV